jgi:hypothetical protein
MPLMNEPAEVGHRNLAPPTGTHPPSRL